MPNEAGGRGQPVQINGARDPDYVAYVFVLRSIIISRLYQLTDVFTPNPSHSATVTWSFRFSVKIFSRSPLAGGGKVFFLGGGVTEPPPSAAQKMLLAS